MKANLDVNGMAEYFETLAQVEKDMDEEALSLVKEVADIVADEIRTRTPVGDASRGDPHPGQLLAHVVSTGPFKDGNRYYAYAEVDMRDRETMLYAVYNEWGTPTMAARPYIRPGIRAGIRRGDKIMIERLLKVVS